MAGKAEVKSGEAQTARPTWSNKMDFIMASLSAAIGLGNLWRFPYQCYKNGGGAFLLPFLLMTLLLGLPQVIVDLGLSQYGRRGALTCWDAAPIMTGTGWTIFFTTCVLISYYAVIVSYGAFYMFASFTRVLPWSTCNNWWNTPQCQDFGTTLRKQQCADKNGTWFNMTCFVMPNDTHTAAYRSFVTTYNLINVTDVGKPVSPSDEYFHSYVLRLTTGLHDLGTIRWTVMLCLLLVLVLCFLALILGVRTWGKASYVTTIMPYIILLALLIQGLMQEGSVEGLIYFFQPRWEKLASLSVWADAAVQAFLSLGAGAGTLLTIGSHNRFHNNCIKDALIVTFSDVMTSLLCGVVVFCIVGNMAHELGVGVEDVVGQDASMAFVVYPDMLARMPAAPVWAVLFNFMLFSLGLGSVVAAVSVLRGSILDFFPKVLLKGRRPIVVLLAAVFGVYLLGVIYTTEGGMYVLQMVDNNLAYIVLLIAIAKNTTVGWIYGADRFLGDLAEMSGWKIPRVFGCLYRFLSPILLATVLVLRLMNTDTLRYGAYVYPKWSTVLSWLLVFLHVSIIPAVAVGKVFTTNRDLPILQRLRILSRPAADWGPGTADLAEGRPEKDATVPLQMVPGNEQEQDTASHGADRSVYM